MRIIRNSSPPASIRERRIVKVVFYLIGDTKQVVVHESIGLTTVFVVPCLRYRGYSVKSMVA